MIKHDEILAVIDKLATESNTQALKDCRELMRLASAAIENLAKERDDLRAKLEHAKGALRVIEAVKSRDDSTTDGTTVNICQRLAFNTLNKIRADGEK